MSQYIYPSIETSQLRYDYYMRQENQTMSHNCPFCSRLFPWLDGLQEHVILEHHEPQPDHQLVGAQVFGPLAVDQVDVYGATNFDFVLPLPIQSLTKQMVGDLRGVQGDSNSCYIDAMIMALFAFSTTLDKSLTEIQPSSSAKECLLQAVRDLRRHLFVSSNQIHRFRQLLDIMTKSQFQHDVQDTTDFLRVLLQDVLHLPALQRIAYKNFDEYILQFDKTTLIALTANKKTPTVLELLLTLHERPVLSETGLLFIQLPRSQSMSLFSGIIPDLSLAWPKDFCASKQMTSLSLKAVICIEIAHYVAFIRTASNQWVFSDSMADRNKERSLPRLALCPEIGEWLKNPKNENDNPMVKRFRRDAYVLMYERTT